MLGILKHRSWYGRYGEAYALWRTHVLPEGGNAFVDIVYSSNPEIPTPASFPTGAYDFSNGGVVYYSKPVKDATQNDLQALCAMVKRLPAWFVRKANLAQYFRLVMADEMDPVQGVEDALVEQKWQNVEHPLAG